MGRKKSQSVSESISFCSPMASFVRADAIAPIGQFDYETALDLENQEKVNTFEEGKRDIETADTGNSDFQASLGSLDLTEEHCSFETLDEKFEEVDINALDHFVGIPDFNTPTDSKYPFVVHTPSGYHCTDGWGLVEAAKAAGRTSIICDVEYVQSYSEVELCIRKAAGRVKPKAGISSYGETIRNTKYVERGLLASNKDLKVFSHGGGRRGQAFTNNIEDNLRKVLSIRLGRSVTTINQFLNHGAFLDDVSLNFLASENTPKEFFEQAQIHKRTEITTMKSSRVSDEDITAQISTKMLDWHTEYKATGKITPVWIQSETDTETGSERRSISTRSPRNHQVPKPEAIRDSDADDTPDDDIEPPEETTEAEIMEEVPSNPEGVDTVEVQQDLDSLENVKGDVEELAKRLLAAITLDDPTLFYEQIVEEVACLHRISLRAAYFRKEATVLEH